jgi:Rieske Fe-S protein
MQNISRRVFGSFLGSILTVFAGSKVFAASKPTTPVKKKIAKPAKKPTSHASSPVRFPHDAPQNADKPVALTDIPVGESLSATYVDSKTKSVQSILLHRTTATTVVAFSAICSHRGCIVAALKPTSFDCPCHGSSYDSQTGSVLNGPALRALTPLSVKVQKGVLVIVPR